MNAMDAAGDETTLKKSIASKVETTIPIDESNTYCTVTGSYIYDNPNMYPVTIDLTFTWNEYVYEDVTLKSGTVTYYVNMTSDSAFSVAYDGSFVLVYNGETYNITWDIDYSYDGVTETFSGTYSINGENYTWDATY
jgi:hypothetical protein